MPTPVSLGPHRLSLPRGASRDERVARSREMLCRAFTLGTTIAFVGAGLSVPLGYPRWQGMALDLIRRTLKTVRGHPSDLKKCPELDTLDSFELRLAAGEPTRVVELTFALGLCQHLAKELRERDPEVGDFVGAYFYDAFKPRDETRSAAPNPYDALLELRIRRFVTTNYDEEIERALERKRGVERKSLTQLASSYDQLTLFLLGKVEEVENTVFHCHGRYDEPESIVASEEDYQRWYLGDRKEAPGFRQTIELLLGSNPILFMGYGLQDEDLLQPLRLLAAADARKKETGSVFALMPEDPDGGSRVYHDSLRVRYGVQVIPFEQPSSDSPQAWGEAWARELGKLAQDGVAWRESWISKPYIRRVEVHARPPEPYQHYNIGRTEKTILGRASVEKALAKIEEKIDRGARVVTVVGHGGTGKSWHAMRLIERLRAKPKRFAGYFFWSSYYADDALTGLDRMLAYLEKPNAKSPGNRLDRLKDCLAKDRYLVVLDGIERLLRETVVPQVGQANSTHVKELMEFIAFEKSKSCVILTTRLLPEPYQNWSHGDQVRVVELDRMSYDDIRPERPFKRFAESEVHALCSLLEGHAYALVLAAGYLSSRPERQAGEALRSLLHGLSATPPDRRVSRMIKEAIAALAVEESRLARKFLQHVAAFMSPVTERTARHCYDLAVDGRKAQRRAPSPAPKLETLLRTLLERELLFVAEDGESGKAYTVHPTVRSFVFEPKYSAPTDPLPNFTLAGFTSGTAALHPGSEETCELIDKLFDRLVTASEEAWVAGRHGESRALCRSAFSVLRSRMEAITASRWTTYDKYARYHYRLIDLARQISSPGLWRYVDPPSLASVEHPDAPLYADELAWVYNDLGLILCAEGDMPDTYGIWEQGSEINHAIDLGQRVGQHVVQSLLHLSHTYVEIGHLRIAGAYLHDTERANHSFKDPDYAARIAGYRGLIAHLEGNLHKAEDHYHEAIRHLEEQGRNPRAESIFRRHLADLSIAKGDLERAREEVRICRALAESAEYRDLVAYARISQGHVYRAAGALNEAMPEYLGCLRMARQIGIRRLEADALSELSRLALDLGDAENARRQAMAALRLSNELGLGLRKTHGLVVLGLATVRTGPVELGKSYLRQALRMAEAQGYWLRGHEIEHELEKLGEPPELSRVSRRGTM